MTFQKIIISNNSRKRQIELECDQCGKIFIKRYCKRFLNADKLTFCSRKCVDESRKKGNILNQQTKEVCLKHYGVTHSFQSEIVKEKCRNTWMKKYGVKNPYQSTEIKEKIKLALIDHYGVENPMQSIEIQEKIKLTNLKKYGVTCPLQTQKNKENLKKVWLIRYGVDHPMKSNEIQKKCKETLIKNYGVDHPSKSDVIKKKIKETCLKHYGVKHHLKSDIVRSKIDYKLAALRCHETMKRNGTYRKSNIEDKFYKFLCEKFGEENVERQVRVNNWNIDFFLRSKKTYIQFDGVYWHGLDRDVKIIKEFKNHRDKVIYKTYLRDQEQNEWFKKNKLKLIRVTDNDFKLFSLEIDLFKFPSSS